MSEELLLYVIKTICGTVEVFGELIIGLVLFRLPYFHYFKEITLISLFIATIMTICYGVLSFHFIINETIDILLLVLLTKMLIKSCLRLSFIIAISGYLLKNALFALILTFMNVSVHSLIFSPIVTCFFQIISSLLLTIVGFLLYKFGYGFTLIKVNKIRSYRLKKIDRILFVVIIMNILLMHTSVFFLMSNHPFSSHLVLLFLFMVNVVLFIIHKRSKMNMELEFENRSFSYFRNLV